MALFANSIPLSSRFRQSVLRFSSPFFSRRALVPHCSVCQRPAQTLSHLHGVVHICFARFLYGVAGSSGRIITSNTSSSGSWRCLARTIRINVYGIFASTWL